MAPPPAELALSALAIQFVNMHPSAIRVEPEVKAIAAPLTAEVREVNEHEVNVADSVGVCLVVGINSCSLLLIL